jgi:hypothetical protein
MSGDVEDHVAPTASEARQAMIVSAVFAPIAQARSPGRRASASYFLEIMLRTRNA